MLTWLYRLGDAVRDRARRRQWSAEMATGRRGEDIAHRYLARRGYRVVARNYRPPSGSGEIDLVAWDGDVLVFVEVKTRTTDEFGAPERAVDRDKETHVDRAARDYARRAGMPLDRARFDVVSVVMDGPPRVELLRDAFRIHC
jgi:putative endonuclease